MREKLPPTVELGMTPAQAIVAATKNGALACRLQKELGTTVPAIRAFVLMRGTRHAKLGKSLMEIG